MYGKPYVSKSNDRPNINRVRTQAANEQAVLQNKERHEDRKPEVLRKWCAVHKNMFSLSYGINTNGLCTFHR